ncbi:hypothetical protein VL10_09415 [Leclercia adecarboxylata]|nr:hypothetical protein VL10_09415 [Leclercia adecarboxylata]KMN61760.1 hypothetical protein VK95_23085 [Leclercia sp. LK8]
MYTSDPDAQQWQPWEPSDLLCEETTLPSEELPGISESPESDETALAELAKLRQQAEQQGFARGQQRGLEAGEKKGYEEGFARGMQEGMAELKDQQQRFVTRFSHLLDEFTSSLSSLDSVIPSRLVQLALTAARSVVGANIAVDHGVVLDKIRQLLQQEAWLKGNAQLRVSPEDYAMVQENLGETLTSLHWVLREDEQILPGGCRITSDEGEFDATLSSRWEELCHLSREEHF